MKYLVIFIACCVLAVLANQPFDDDETRVHGENGWYVPTQFETFEWIDKDDAEQYLEAMEKVDNFLLSTNPVTFYVYTRANPSKGTKLEETVKSLQATNFDGSKPTIFSIHGWTQRYTSGMNKDIRTAWLKKIDCNVIVVDWGRARGEYALAVAAVPKVGKKVASLIDFLNKYGNLNFDTLTIAGHSLGAHVAGFAGKNVKNGQVNTIIGMDPALPLFSYDKPKKRLASTDAFYVQSIQTNGGVLGFLQPIGKGAFYPNGGKTQPGCPLDLTGACSHGRSTTYYVEAVSYNNFGSIKCGDYKQAVADSCGATFSAVRMGAILPGDKTAGDFYVPVYSKPLFGIFSNE